MPATVVSSASGWAVYLASALIFAAVLSPGMAHVQEASKVESATKTIAGVQKVLDSLGPGLLVSLKYGTLGETAEIITGGHNIIYIKGDTAVSFATKWVLPNYVLLPGLEYFFWVAGGYVEVSQVGRS